MQVYLVTGCSSGIGLGLASEIIARGHKVYCTIRSRNKSAAGMAGIRNLEEAGAVIIENIEMREDDVGEKIAAVIRRNKDTLDVVIHNAGSLNGGVSHVKKDKGTSLMEQSGALFREQKLYNIKLDVMRATFEVNALGPLKVQKALRDLLSENAKIGLISSGFGSISDNTTGGNYAYRTSKAALNMIGKSLSADLRDDGIAVVMIGPGFRQTEFGPGLTAMKKFGAKPLRPAVCGILEILQNLKLERTGEFLMISSTDNQVKEMGW